MKAAYLSPVRVFAWEGRLLTSVQKERRKAVTHWVYRVMSDRVRIGRAMRVAQAHAEKSHNQRRPLVDDAYLDALAERLAELCRLPLALAQARVRALAISAQPPPVDNGFQTRSM